MTAEQITPIEAFIGGMECRVYTFRVQSREKLFLIVVMYII